VYQRGRSRLSARIIRKAILVLTLLGATLPTAAASAQTPPPLPGGTPVFPVQPGLTPFPGTVGPQIRQFDCRSYWVRSAEPPHRLEQQTVCFGWEVIRP
jgi:hypothetical protein